MKSQVLVDDGGHGDLQELLLEGDEGQQAGVEQTEQLQHPGQAEQHGDTRVLQQQQHTSVTIFMSSRHLHHIERPYPWR